MRKLSVLICLVVGLIMVGCAAKKENIIKESNLENKEHETTEENGTENKRVDDSIDISNLSRYDVEMGTRFDLEDPLGYIDMAIDTVENEKYIKYIDNGTKIAIKMAIINSVEDGYDITPYLKNARLTNETGNYSYPLIYEDVDNYKNILSYSPNQFKYFGPGNKNTTEYLDGNDMYYIFDVSENKMRDYCLIFNNMYWEIDNEDIINGISSTYKIEDNKIKKPIDESAQIEGGITVQEALEILEKELQYKQYDYEPAEDYGRGEVSEVEEKTYNEETQEMEFELKDAYIFRFENSIENIPYFVYVFSDGSYQFSPPGEF